MELAKYVSQLSLTFEPRVGTALHRTVAAFVGQGELKRESWSFRGAKLSKEEEQPLGAMAIAAWFHLEVSSHL